MIKSLPSLARIGVSLALCLFYAWPAPAQEAAAEEAVLYQTWSAANSQQVQEKAIETAEVYVAKFPNGQHAAYLKGWLLQPKLQAFSAAAEAHNTDQMIKVGRDILKSNPEHLGVLAKQGGFKIPGSQTPWQEIQRGMVDELSNGMVLKPAVKYQKIAATKGVPRDNH